MCGQDIQEPGIELRIHECSHLVLDQAVGCVDIGALSDTQHLSFFTDHQDVGVQDPAHDLTDIVEHDLSCIIVVDQFFYFSCIVQ